MKFIITLALLLNFSTSFSQWTRVQQLPASDISTLYHKDSVLYAGGKNIIYFSRDKGQTWDSTASIPQLFFVNNIIVFKKELYAAAPNKGVFKSADGGTTWQNISAGLLFPDVADFTEWRGDLYAATFGNSVYKLNPATTNNWLFFSNGLSNLSANTPAIAGNNNALIAGTLANGIYGHLPANSTTWEERLLLGQISPNEGVYDIVTGHDTLFYSGRTGRFYMSTDNGLTWNLFGNRLSSFATTVVNAKQAVLLSRRVLENGSFKIRFYYIKKDSLQHPFVNFSTVSNHFTYRIDILGDKLWDASDKGLFFMSLSDLPGITPDDVPVIGPVPVHFISFNTACDENKVQVTWKTSQEQNSSHFNIEKSIDGIHWTVIGNIPAAGNSNSERTYSFADNSPVQNCYYRIAEFDLDGHTQYTGIARSSCSAKDIFNVWPNPAHDFVFINIVADKKSQAAIKLFDSKGALVKTQNATILTGSNKLVIDIGSLASGVYSLSVKWDNAQIEKTVQVLKK